MYQFLLSLHSVFRWLVLLSLLAVLVTHIRGWMANQHYKRSDGLLRTVATSIVHTQLLIGFTLYFQSPIVSYFTKNFREGMKINDMAFFGLYHISLMLISIIVMTIGSSLAKRSNSNREKFRTTVIYFLVALIIILAAIPWPFSPFATRPYFRAF